MSRQYRLLLLLISTQAACLVFSLWIQDRFLLAGANWHATHHHSGPGTVSTASGHHVLTVDALLDGLFESHVLGFIWAFGLQSIVAYLVFTRLSSEHQQRELQSHEESLLRAKELLRTRDAVIFGLAKLAESRDPDTGQHLERIAMYATRLASGLRRHARYRDIVTPGFVRTIGISSALHDIGKVGVEDAVLLKPGRLSQEERFRMQIHPILGGECIRQIEQQLGNSNFLEMAREIAYCHHERWDGDGYPVGLAGEEIPLSARIVAIADVYDALASRRIYKDAYPHEKCVEIIRQESGHQFDPNLVEVFLSIHEQFRDIGSRFSDLRTECTHPTEPVDADEARDLSEKLTAAQERVLTQTVSPAALASDEIEEWQSSHCEIARRHSIATAAVGTVGESE